MKTNKSKQVKINKETSPTLSNQELAILNINNPRKLQITKEQLNDFKKEYEYRSQTYKVKLSDALNSAISEGDYFECDSFYVTNDLLKSNRFRLRELTDIIKNAEIITNNPKSNSGISIGSHVRIVVENVVSTFQIVEGVEANPFKKKISVESPLGKALLGKKQSDEFEIELNGKKKRIKVLKIDK